MKSDEDDFSIDDVPVTPEEKTARRRAAAIEAAKRRKVAVARGELRKMLDEIGIEEICDRVEAGQSLTQVCDWIVKSTGEACDMGALHRWINSDEQRSARYIAARKASASAYDTIALNVLKDAPATKEGVMKAREIAQHYRWMAKTRDPRTYGEKLDLDVKSETKLTMPEVDAQLSLLLDKFTKAIAK